LTELSFLFGIEKNRILSNELGKYCQLGINIYKLISRLDKGFQDRVCVINSTQVLKTYGRTNFQTPS
jgi:hypothetical protein